MKLNNESKQTGRERNEWMRKNESEQKARGKKQQKPENSNKYNQITQRRKAHPNTHTNISDKHNRIEME